MTAIVGLVHGGKVWIGSDSAGVGGLALNTRKDPKVFRNGEFIFGYTTSFRMGQLLEFDLSPPVQMDSEPIMQFMVKRFVPAVRDCLKTGGFQSVEKGQEYGGTFLVGYRGELFEIESDYQVSRVQTPFNACGCGRDIALGNLHATQRMRVRPDIRITMALEAAAEFSAGVRGPFTIISSRGCK